MISTHQIILASKQFIRNSKLPTCSSCIFYKENIINKKKQMLCTKFGIKNIISGTITYETVLESRLDNDKCGEKGEHYIEKYLETIKN
jgi:hypothetical protein